MITTKTRMTNKTVVIHLLLLFIIATIISSDNCWYVIRTPGSTTTMTTISNSFYVVEALQGVRIVDSSKRTSIRRLISNTIHSSRRKQYEQDLKYSSIIQKRRNHIVSLSSLTSTVDNKNEDDNNNSTNTNTNTITNGYDLKQQQQEQLLTTSSLQPQQQGIGASTTSPLFSLDQSTSIATTTSTGAKKSFDFGQSVSIRDRPTATSIETTATSVPILTSTTTTTTTEVNSNINTNIIKIKDEYEIVQDIKRRNSIVGIGSVGIGLIKYMYQYYNPKQPIQLLVEMTIHSPSVTTIGTNNKPTIIDFWAPWCDTCQQLAPTLYSLKEQYVGIDTDSTGSNTNIINSPINFISIDGNEQYNANIISKFRVDAIPHIAFITADGDVLTALIGPVPRSVLQANIDYLIQYTTTSTSTNANKSTKNTNSIASTPSTSTTSTITDVNQLIQDLPYTMFDAFENLPSRRIQFTSEEIQQIQVQQQQFSTKKSV